MPANLHLQAWGWLALYVLDVCYLILLRRSTSVWALSSPLTQVMMGWAPSMTVLPSARAADLLWPLW